MNPRPHQRDENAGTELQVSSAATDRPRRPSERTATSACLRRASRTSASNAIVARTFCPRHDSRIGPLGFALSRFPTSVVEKPADPPLALQSADERVPPIDG